jgi:hypothetical protein
MPECPECDFSNPHEDTMEVHRKITGHARPLSDAEREEMMMREWAESREHRLEQTQEELEEETTRRLREKREEMKRRFRSDELSAVNPVVGQVIYVPGTGEYKYWNGDRWVVVDPRTIVDKRPLLIPEPDDSHSHTSNNSAEAQINFVTKEVFRQHHSHGLTDFNGA